MVFKPFTHLARQTFSKTLSHGYAQSVVAASQSSYASQTTGAQLNHQLSAQHSALKLSRAAQLQNAFHSSAAPAGLKGHHQDGLTAYYNVYHAAQADEAEWKQPPFSKRIGWTPVPKDAEEREAASPETASSVRSPESPQSRNLNDADLMRLENIVVNADVSAKVDEAVAREMQQIEVRVTQETPEQAASPAADQSKLQCDYIIRLASEGKFGLIPATFESLLRDGLVPTTAAYNALLEAAIQLHSDIHHAVPKALDLYTDMLRRHVAPDDATYQTIIQLLASRALSCVESVDVLERQRVRFGGLEEPGKFILPSSEAERELLREDHSLPIVLKLFFAAVSRNGQMKFPSNLYSTLIAITARRGEVDQMIRVVEHIESSKVTPEAIIFPLMIDAFAANGDLKSAVECYNEYKSLAIADDNGVFGIIGRADGQVYSSVIKAYLTCGKHAGGVRFLEKISSSYDSVSENKEERRSAMESIIVKDGIIQHALSTGKFADAIQMAKLRLNSRSRMQQMALNAICTAAADAGDVPVSTEAYNTLVSTEALSMESTLAMMALHVRRGDVSSAKPFWSMISTSMRVSSDLIQPTAMYTVALIKSGMLEEGLMEARNMFARIRAASSDLPQSSQAHLREEIDETIELHGRLLVQQGAILSSQAAMNLIWTMLENGGLVSPVAENAIASLGPKGIAHLSVQDLAMAMQVQAGMLVGAPTVVELAHPQRFAHMLDMAMSTGLPVETLRHAVIEQGISKISPLRPDLVHRYHQYVQPKSSFASPVIPAATVTPVPPQFATSPVASPVKSTAPEDNYDPYAHSTDFRGSALIAEELESSNGRAQSHLNDALIKFRNMRRIGRHPRYITYAKLITAAAKCGRMSLVQEILGMARHDVPLLPQYNVIKYGWTSILDAMVAACLTLGDRVSARNFHQELLSIGAAPSANTFGLYITTLKESTKTFDEATEAVHIFHRATAEGVEPTSFLYNALIGKLGKARRIDDCLLYFAEMRANGVRPTSVTYGTIVNALCRVSDERFAEEMFDEMESMPNYKPRPAPYNSMIQYFLNTKRDRSKVLAYYERMRSRGIQPTMHTYKLLIDAYAALEPIRMDAAEQVLDAIRATGERPEAVHYASLIHAKGCVLHDMAGASVVFDTVLPDEPGAVSSVGVKPQACLYQALFESMVANHQVAATTPLLAHMAARGVDMTPYIANTLIHGWAAEGDVARARAIYDDIGINRREPSTYEAMTRAFLSGEDRRGAGEVVAEMVSRGYPAAVTGKVLELVGGGGSTPLVPLTPVTPVVSMPVMA